MNRIKEFLEKVGIKYNNSKAYETPFLHSSYIHETPWDDQSYDRLEFLGDSLLGFYASEYLFRNFPEYNEGDMTLVKHYLVNKEGLSKVGRRLKLEDLLFLGQGEDRDNLSDSIYEDVMESLIGAIYLDAGHEEAKKFVIEYILKEAQNVTADDVKDSKTKLQELLQGETRKSVTYRTDKGVRDEDSKMLFKAQAIFEDMVIGEGTGFSKKEAEKNAAQDAIDRKA